MRSAWLAIFLVVGSGFPAAVFAQSEESQTEAVEEAPSAPTAELEDEGYTAPPEGQVSTPTEPPTWWFGAYLQGNFVPSFMLKLLLDAAPTVANAGFGITATHRSQAGVSLVLGLGYASYGFQGPFRITGDPETDTEFLESSLGLLHARAAVLWSTSIVPNMLSFEYGVGVDLGVVLGSLMRTEAFPDPTKGGEFSPCVGKLQPNPAFCEPTIGLGATDAYNAQGAHYHVQEKRVPPVAATLMLPALALRYTPTRALAVKLDAAFGLLQFSVGVSAAYGLDL